MSKVSVSSRATVFAGIDVSAATLAVAVQREDREGFEQREFANSAAGHKQLIELRRRHPVFRRTRFFDGTGEQLPDVWWMRPDWRWIGRKASRWRC